MIRVSKKIEYALIALKHMYDKAQNELTTAREIGEIYHAPFDTTSKVLQSLNNAGIVTGQKGLKGGYSLSYDLSKLSYFQLSEIIEGKSFNADCIVGVCDMHSTCNISGPMKNLHEASQNFFNSLMLASLFTDTNLLKYLTKNPTEYAHES